jgi:MFS family permease
VISSKSLKKLGLLGSLYLSQGIPVMFLFQSLPVFMRQQGVSLAAIGLFPLLGLPAILKFLWSPIIDRYGFTRWGHYRFWIICFQFLVACAVFVCAWLDIKHNFTALLLVALLIVLFCSSQDIATDALAVGLLEPDERGMGNGVQTSGGYLGAVIGGGGMLLLLNDWGWTVTLLTIAAIMLVALLPILRHQERVKKAGDREQEIGGKANRFTTSYLQDRQKAPPLLSTSLFMDLVNFCRRPGMWRWLLILVLYTVGGMITGTMFRPLLVDIGLSLTEVGLLLGVVSQSAGMLGAITAGFFIAPLGRKRSLIVFGLLQSVMMIAYLLPASGVTSLPVLYLVAIGVQFTLSMATTATCTVMMDQSELATAGTDYTIQTSVVFLGGFSAAALSGVIAEAIGYQGVFALSIAISFISVVAIARFFPETGFSQPNKSGI